MAFANFIPYSAICYPIALVVTIIGFLLFRGLPNYYHQAPGKIASFYKAVFRRKIVLWNFVFVILQNFFLSAPYGRNWSCTLPALAHPQHSPLSSVSISIFPPSPFK